MLEQTVAKLGGREQAAALLGITPSLLQRFLDGALKVPDQLLLKAVDLLSESAPMEPQPQSHDPAPGGTTAGQ